jgi:predicted secreted protein with PEFG-CTERM motif
VANHYYLLAVLAIAFVAAASLLLHSSFSQRDNATQLNATGTNAAPPALENISDKGIYKVQLLWPQTINDAQNALQVEIDFYNASAPPPTSATIPEKEGNATGSGTEAGMTVPQTIGGEPLRVESYDMTLYSQDGKKLWEKLNQPGEGGRATQRIVLDSPYRGPVTVQLSNIKPGWLAGGAAADAANMTDSVKFTATIVPEFPVAMVILAVGITTTIAVLGRRRLI